MSTLPHIKSIIPAEDYVLVVVFDDGSRVLYDVKDDMKDIECFNDLRTIDGLWQQVQLDKSRTMVYWNEHIDLPSDTIYEYGKKVGV
jgi:hypothetical protein